MVKSTRSQILHYTEKLEEGGGPGEEGGELFDNKPSKYDFSNIMFCVSTKIESEVDKKINEVIN